MIPRRLWILVLALLAPGTGVAQERATLDHGNRNEVVDPKGLERLRAEFRSMIKEGLHPGAQLAVYHAGNLVIQLAAGLKEPNGGKVTSTTLFQIRSVSKIVSMAVMMRLYDQGKFDFDDRVAEYWPEFAQNGKEKITIGQILAHRAGLPQSPFTSKKDIANRKSTARAIEAMKPRWKPGTKNGYHASTIGYVSDEIVYRVAGRSLGDILRKDILKPLGLRDIYLGLPASQYPRMAKMTRVDWQPRARKRVSDFLNTKEGIGQELSWVSIVATATELADFMNLFVFEGTYKGKRIFSKKVLARVARPTNRRSERDQVLKLPIRWGLGFMLSDTPDVFGSRPNRTVMGHAGGGATVAWADPKNRVAVAFLSNGMLNRRSWERYRRVADLVYGALRLPSAAYGDASGRPIADRRIKATTG